MKLFSSILALIAVSPALAADYPSPHFKSITLDTPAVLPHTIRCSDNPDATSGTDRTADLQAAINAAQASGTGSGLAAHRLDIRGFCFTGPLTISYPIEIVGDGSQSSGLILNTGSTAPALTVSTSWVSVNYYENSGQPAHVRIAGLKIKSPNNSDPAGAGVAHGIAFINAATKPVYTSVVLDDIDVAYMPADGLSATAWNGYVTAYNLRFTANRRNNLYLNSVFDWRFYGMDASMAVQDNFVLSGSAGIECYGCNIYTAGRYNLNIYSTLHDIGPNKWIGGAIDGAQQHGVYYRSTGLHAPFLFMGTNINDNGVSAPGTYSDIYVASDAASNNLSLVGVTFNGPNAVYSSMAAQYNIYFAGTTTASLSGVFIAGTPAQAFNSPNLAVGTVVSSAGVQSLGSTTIVQPAQYGGLYLKNGSVTVGKMIGIGTDNDDGLLNLNSNGTTTAQIAASVPNFFTTNAGFGGQVDPQHPIDVTGEIVSSKWIAAGSYIVSGLPGSTTPAGARAHVTDAINCATRLSIVIGGGSTFCPVIYNGTVWVQD